MTPGRWEWVDTPRLIPVDRVAEESLAGKAIVSGDDAHYITRLVGEDEFHDPRCWAVIEAAADPRMDPLNDDGIDWCGYDSDLAMLVQGCCRRSGWVANLTGLELSWVRQLVTRRSPLQTDRLVDRLIDAVVMRRDNRFMVDRLIENGVDVRMLTNFDAWMGTTQALLLQACRSVGAALYGDGSDAVMAGALADLGAIFRLDADEVSGALRPPGDTDA